MVLAQYIKDKPINMKRLVAEINYTESQLTNLAVIQYPDALIERLSALLNKNKSVIWKELLQLEDETAITEVQKLDAFIEAIETRQAYIYIPEPLRSEQHHLVQSVMTEEDRLGFELGSRGTGNLLAELIYRVSMAFDKESPSFKQLKSKLRHYYVKTHDEMGSLLYEKTENY